MRKIGAEGELERKERPGVVVGGGNKLVVAHRTVDIKVLDLSIH